MTSADFSKQEINKLVLNYLVTEGYESTSLKFAKEIGVDLDDKNPCKSAVNYNEPFGIKSIGFRKRIKLLILNGDIQTVIDQLNIHYPELLETSQFLYFKLLLLNLIEMIKIHNNGFSSHQNKDKDNDIQTDQSDQDPNQFILKIIKFAQDKLTNKAIKNPQFMEELELAMTLLLYSNKEKPVSGSKSSTASPILPKKLNRLLEFKLRRDIADLINRAILVQESDTLSTTRSYNFIGSSTKFIEFSNEEEDDDLGGKEDDLEQDVLTNTLIDSNLKKLIKFWIWSENTIGLEYSDVHYKKFEI